MLLQVLHKAAVIYLSTFVISFCSINLMRNVDLKLVIFKEMIQLSMSLEVLVYIQMFVLLFSGVKMIDSEF